MPDMLVKLYDLPEDAQTACPRDERTDPPRNGAG